jgi:hypothetical protein
LKGQYDAFAVYVKEAEAGEMRSPLGDQEAVSRDAHRGVVVEAAPSVAFEMSEPDLLLEFLIVTFDVVVAQMLAA